MKCFSKLKIKQKKDFFDGFWGIGRKNTQDTLILNLVEKTDILNPSSKPKSGKNRCASYTYHVKVDSEKLPVCKRFLISLLQITERRVKTILSALNQGALCVEDKRGKHNNRPHRINNDTWELVKRHWDMFPSK